MKAGFTYHMELEPILMDLESDGKLSEELREQILTIISEHSYQLSFTGSEGCEAVMHLKNGDPGYPAEEAEFEIDDDPADLAFHVMAILVSRLPIRYVQHQGSKLILIHQAITDHLNNYLENIGGERAYAIASDWKQERDCQEADFRYDELRDRKMEEEWEHERELAQNDK